MSHAFRPIDPTAFKAPEDKPDVGAAPMLQWLKIEDLVVDDGYQRPIYGAGLTNVRRIVEGFRWSKFAPLIVAPIAGGRFAIIDGQHRATAAAVLGFESVPAQVIIADPVEQAAAFKAINGHVTRIHALAIHHAALSAGDESAHEIESVCQSAGVKVLRYPVASDRIQPGETLALGAIRSGIFNFGRETVITALSCVTETTNNEPGVLCAAVISALCMLLARHRAWRDAGERLLKAFDEIDLLSELEEAKLTRKPKGVSTNDILVERLEALLRVALPAVAA